MPKHHVSGGLLMYRLHDGNVEVLLAHPGGPFFSKKDEGVWTIPKGELEPDENFLEAAQREFREETGFAPEGPFIGLTPVKQKGGKIIHAWAVRGDCDPTEFISNLFSVEWPPHSGRQMKFPEIDQLQFFDIAMARRKINAGQLPLIDELEKIVSRESDPEASLSQP